MILQFQVQVMFPATTAIHKANTASVAVYSWQSQALLPIN